MTNPAIQLSLDFESTSTELTAANVGFNHVFKDLLSKRILIRVKPTGFLLNSSIITDIINRNDVLVFSPKHGTLYSIPGDRPIEMLEATLNVRKP